jgi:hypothetical protein
MGSTGKYMREKIYHRCLSLLLGLVALLCFSTGARAETFRKSYTFDYNRATRKASETRAEGLARKRFLLDFMSTKFSKEIVTNLEEEILTALEPAEDYLLDFERKGTPKLNDDETKITIVVEGNVDLPGMISALVRNKVLSFGEKPPKVMFLPSASFESPKAAKTLRALLFDKLRQSGLQSVAFEGTTQTLSTQIKGTIKPNSAEFRVLQKLLTEYNADYLLYVDAEVENRPASVGGFICDSNFIYTVVRPSNNLILAESVISERGSGNTAMVAFDKTLDAAAPDLVNQAIGQLYQAIYADSDVIYETPQQRNSITVTVYDAKSDQVQKIIDALQTSGASVSLGTGTGVSSRLKVETTLDTLGLYNFFNEQTYSATGAKFTTPVVGYAENTIDIEVTGISKPPSRPKPAKPPEARPAKATNRQPDSDNRGDEISRLKSRTKPAVTLKLKPVSYNR